jgi:methyl-accepting chemotaxis protein
MNSLTRNLTITRRILVVPMVTSVLAILCWLAAITGGGTRGALWLSTALLGIAVVLSFTIAIILSKGIVSRINRLKTGIKKVSAGDLTWRVGIEGKDELAEIGEEVNRFLEGLLETIVEFAASSIVASNTAFLLDQANKKTIEGVEQTAGQMGAVAAASEEMSSTSSEIARNCSSAAKSAETANSTAMAGESVMEETAAVMGRINEIVKMSASIIESLGSRSDQIGVVINLIDDIADQTNLLALNAAIEAARAGEHGRGFAVVADEVRQLAEKTTAATKEIGAMIKGMQAEAKRAVTAMKEGVSEVEAGAEETNRSRTALKEILVQIDVVSREIGQIAVAAEQQTATTNEISASIHEVSQVMDVTVKSVAANSQAASEFAKSSMVLSRVVNQYRITTEADIEALVDRVADYCKTHGREKTLSEINNPKGQSVKNGLYVIAFDLDGNVLAHGLDRAAVGANFAGLRDAEGRCFVKETIQIAKSKGEGWLKIPLKNPVTNKIQLKHAHFRKAGDMIIVSEVNM